MKKIIAICGKSASGKDTLLNRITGAHRIVATTTRPPREGEAEGVDYHYTDYEHFDKRKMLEFAMFRGWWYGTSIDELSEEEVNIGIFNPRALEQIYKKKELEVIPIYLDIDGKTRLLRSLNREKDVDVYEICRRYIADETDFIYVQHSNYPNLIITHSIEEAEKKILDILN